MRSTPRQPEARFERGVLVASLIEEPWPEAWPRGRRRVKWTRVTRRFGVPQSAIGDRLGCLPPMTTRLRAHAMEHATLVLTGWAALHVLGLPVFCDEMPVEVASRTNKRATSVRAVQHVKYERRIPLADRARFSPKHFDLPGDVKAVCAEEALVRCLISLLKGRNAWALPNERELCKASGMSAPEIRAVQLIDSTRRHVGVVFSEVERLAQWRLSNRTLKRLWDLSVPNADSPPETTLRLLLRDLLPDIRTQVPVYVSRSSADDLAEEASSVCRRARRKPTRVLTWIDIASRKLRIALFYDGVHHNSQRQREHDARVDRVLQARGATVLRYTASSMRNPSMVRRQVQQVIARNR